MKGLNKLTLAVCLLSWFFVLLLCSHIDSLVTDNYRLTKENRALAVKDSLDFDEIVKLRVKLIGIEIDNTMIKRENYRLKQKVK